ncbi:hypothetical protein FQN50_006444 [Emmonsiellopsis sp. PD_5]|nr:hypothetical protein FQN50_006444 [Emmonsiellopsis sp. PD_5]
MARPTLSPKARRIILTAGVTIITITGSMYGAGLKMDQDAKKEAEKQQLATPAEKIQALQTVRDELVLRRTGLERQIRDVKARQEKRRVADGGGNGNGNGNGKADTSTGTGNGGNGGR